MKPNPHGSADGALRGKRVLALATFDSFFRAAVRLGTTLQQHGAEVEYGGVFRRKGQLSRQQCEEAGLDVMPRMAAAEAFARGEYGRHDLVILALGTQQTRKFLVEQQRHAAGTQAPVPTVSLFPGIIFRGHYESFCSRASSDLVLLNSPADRQRYTELTRELGLADNGALFGLTSLAPRTTTHRTGPERGTILYVDQPTVPERRDERRYILARLIELARAHPGEAVAIKPRHRPDETTLHRTQHHFADLMREAGRRERIPKNLLLIYGPMQDALMGARLVLTVSSTATLEAVALGIPTRVLTDLGVHERLGNHVFIGSGLFATFDEIRPDLQPSVAPTWLERHMAWVEDHEADVVGRIAALMEDQTRRHTTALFGQSEAATAFLTRRQGRLGPLARSVGRVRAVARTLTGRRQ